MDWLCHVRNTLMYVLLWWTVSVLTRVLFWCLFPSLLRTREVNTKITLSWALKQFVTWVHTLFSMCHYDVVSVISHPHNRVRCGRKGGGAFVSLNSDLYSASVNTVLYENCDILDCALTALHCVSLLNCCWYFQLKCLDIINSTSLISLWKI